MTAPIPSAALEAFFTGIGAQGAIVMRNRDFFASLERGGDCDLFVPSIEAAQRLMVRHLGLPDRIARRSYVTSYFYQWGYIDLFSSYSWRGIELVPFEQLARLASLSGELLVPALPPHLEAATTWTIKLLFNGTSGPKYRAALNSGLADQRDETMRMLRRLLGSRWARKVATAFDNAELQHIESSVHGLRRSVLCRSLWRNPAQTAFGMLRFVWFELRAFRERAVPVVATSEVEAIAPAVEAECREIWAAVGGFVVHSSLPHDSRAFTRRFLAQQVRIAKDRSIGRLVLLADPTGNATRYQRMLLSMAPKPDIYLSGTELPSDFRGQVLERVRRRCPIRPVKVLSQ